MIVRVSTRALIFNKILGFDHFTHVVIQGPYPCQQRIGPHSVCSGFCKICHLQGMIKRPGRTQTELFEQRAVRIRQLQQGQDLW